MEKIDNGITSELIQDILVNVKLILGIEDASQDSLMTLYINMLLNNILIRTNRRKFPKELKYVAIDLVKDKFDSNRNNADMQSVQSMSETGRSVNFGISGLVENRLNLIINKQLNENEILINRFRLVYKI